jgi:hypothetical protein
MVGMVATATASAAHLSNGASEPVSALLHRICFVLSPQKRCCCAPTMQVIRAFLYEIVFQLAANLMLPAVSFYLLSQLISPLGGKPYFIFSFSQVSVSVCLHFMNWLLLDHCLLEGPAGACNSLPIIVL